MCPYLSLLSGAKIHQFSWSCPLPWRHLPGRSQLSLLQGGEDPQLSQPTSWMSFGSPTQPQLPVAAPLHPCPLAHERSPQAAGRRGKAGGNPHPLVPRAHCKGNKKLVSFPVQAQQRHHPLPAQESLNTEERHQLAWQKSWHQPCHLSHLPALQFSLIHPNSYTVQRTAEPNTELSLTKNNFLVLTFSNSEKQHSNSTSVKSRQHPMAWFSAWSQ